MQMEISDTINLLQYELNKYSGVLWKWHSLSEPSISLKETSGSIVIT